MLRPPNIAIAALTIAGIVAMPAAYVETTRPAAASGAMSFQVPDCSCAFTIQALERLKAGAQENHGETRNYVDSMRILSAPHDYTWSAPIKSEIESYLSANNRNHEVACTGMGCTVVIWESRADSSSPYPASHLASFSTNIADAINPTHPDLDALGSHLISGTVIEGRRVGLLAFFREFRPAALEN